MQSDFLLGVNYWPRRKAMYWWTNFDAAEVADEFAIIQSLGLSIVRIFLLWDDFQPEPTRVSTEMLKHLETVCDIAAQHQLKLDVTFFTGHMSGPNWSPCWLLDKNGVVTWRQLVSGGQVVELAYRNPFTDEVALDAEKLLLRTVVGALKDHPAIWLWNLGNEPDLFAQPPTPEIGQTWVREMTATIHAVDPVHPVTCGLHFASLVSHNGLRVDQVFSETDIAVMHTYPMYTPWARQPLDPDFVPYTCALAASLAGKPILMEEFGGCTAAPGEPSQVMEWSLLGQPRKQFMASEEDLATFLAETLPRLVSVGATGAFVWCFADYAPELWNRPPCSEFHHERFFGLVRPDGTLKPHADVLRAFAATHPKVQDVPTFPLGISADTFYTDPARYAQELYPTYLATRQTLP